MRLFRIGDKVISREKLFKALEAILEERESGATQEEAARQAGVQRSFVSFLESLGEIRRGPRVALVAFPVANGAEVRELAEKYSLDFALVVNQAERESIESGDASGIFNQLLETLAALRGFDTVIIVASDWRVSTVEKILGTEVVGISLGHTPIREDVAADLAELEHVLSIVMGKAPEQPRGRTGRMGKAIKDVTEIAGRWTQSKRSPV
ncbi:MAG: transcriptional regulator [Coriobacteriia bacterium]|nr:transcriptional regulator [Coriobacteriia bacterium]